MKKSSVAALLLIMHAPVFAHESQSATILHALEHGLSSNPIGYSLGFVFLVSAVVATVRIRSRQ